MTEKDYSKVGKQKDVLELAFEEYEQALSEFDKEGENG